MMNGAKRGTELPGSTWRRLKSAAEYRRFGTHIPQISRDDQVKAIGLLQSLHDGRDEALHDEAFQAKVGEFLLAKVRRVYPHASEAEALGHTLYVLARVVDTDRHIPSR